jgi:hypothetical protein
MSLIFPNPPRLLRLQSQLGARPVGGPLVLSTIAYGVVGIALLANHRHLPPATSRVAIDQRRLSRDQGWFLAIFACTVVLGLVSFALKPWLAFVFVLAYAFYVRHELRGGATAVIALWTLFRRGAMTGRALAGVGLLYLVFVAYVIGHFH